MNKFIKAIAIFLSPIVLYIISAICFLPYLISIKNGPSTEQQISQSFKNSILQKYELLILGNSRTYRGLNPDAFDIACYNFSHDNDSYNQMYYKLKFVLDKGKQFDGLILGVDYFQFSFKSDARNYAYAKYLDKNYMKDFSYWNEFESKMEYYSDISKPKKILTIAGKGKRPVLKPNGQYIRHGVAKRTDSVKRDINRLEIQEKYFKAILKTCQSKGIKVFILMMPCREAELRNYSKIQRDSFNDFISGFVDDKSVFYLNYSETNKFELEDYTDITHLNELAADRFSKLLNNDLATLVK